MAIPTIDTGSGKLVRDGIWVLSRTKPDPRVNGFLPTLQGPQDALVAAMDARRKLDTATIEASGATGFALAGVRSAVLSLGTKAFGFYESRKHPDYLRLFPEAPNAVADALEDKRLKTFDDLVDRSKDKKTPKELADQVKALDAAVAAWKVAVKAEEKAGKALEVGLADERKAADLWHTGVRTLKHQIGTVFPRDTRQVNSYFPKAKASGKGRGKGKKGEPAPAPLPSP